jgi:Kef-type K+ transport system membrane component KefB
MAVPFALGCLLAVALYPGMAGRGVSFPVFGLFVGLAVAVTAFPVLARMLREKRLEQTPLGILALAAAAGTDIIAWTLLAMVLSMVQARVSGAWTVVVLVALLIVMAWTLARPLLAWVWAACPQTGGWAVAIAAVAASGGVYAGNAAGVHAVFGAFVAGLATPGDPALTRAVHKTVLPIVGWFLPIYFALTGLRTELGLLSTWWDWTLCGVVILVATGGKTLGTAGAAWLLGFPSSVAVALGVLMNVRGLMELVVLNAGLEAGIISPALFAMMVVMTLATTLAAGPLISALVNQSQRAFNGASVAFWFGAPRTGAQPSTRTASIAAHIVEAEP